MTWVFFIRLLAGCWSLAGALDAISLDITKFRVGNYCCCELGGHAITLQLQPSSPHLVGLATSAEGQPLIARGGHGGYWGQLGPYPVGLSLNDV